jgi:hypothetical protein
MFCETDDLRSVFGPEDKACTDQVKHIKLRSRLAYKEIKPARIKLNTLSLEVDWPIKR